VSGGGKVQKEESWYVRTLRLQYVKPGGITSFLLFECMIATAILLALAELVSWWAVAALPIAVAAMVKVNDLVSGAPNQGGRVQAVPPQGRRDELSKSNTPAYAGPNVAEPAEVMPTRSSRVYMSGARAAAEAAMEAALVEAAGSEASHRAG
jgi:hypothetical protein